jgi:acyl-CoA dehydrogenase
MVLVPMDAPGVRIERMLPVFGGYDEPFGHGEVSFDSVRVPTWRTSSRDRVAALRLRKVGLGPGRIHHCMRAIGAAERALDLLCKRASSRVAFGKPLVELGGNLDVIADARMQIEQARLLVLKTAWMIDRVGAKAAMSEISQIKVLAPNVACRVIDAAIQMHGGVGVSDDVPLTALYAYARVLRIADGPDEVHRALVGKLELRRHDDQRKVRS